MDNVRSEEVKRIFKEAYEAGLEVTDRGKVANYIPELAKARKDAFGICMMNNDGELLRFGDADTRFTMQSCSKIVNLAVSLKHRGFDETFRHVHMEPTGDAFNSITKLELSADIPCNPMINAGAIQIVSLLADEFSFDDLLEITRAICMDDKIELDEAVYRSERDTGDRNRAIAYLLKSKGVLQAEPNKTLDLYFRLCSMSVSAVSLAGLGLILANNGRNPFNGKQYLEPEYTATIKSLMFTCGLYDGSGEFGVKVGVPAKSGVGGGMVCAAKGPMGIGLYGPSLDAQGNSVAGMRAMRHLSGKLHLHAMDYGY